MHRSPFFPLFADICRPWGIGTPPRKARIIVEVDVNDLDIVANGEDFPDVWFDGERVEVAEESMQLVHDEYNERSRA